MVITDEKIIVTTTMMAAANMTRGPMEFGIPVDPQNPSLGLRWCPLLKMKPADFDAIEEYFLLKNNGGPTT